ncbi:hypothetical protein GGH12_000990 [Coemansia sp. RSA 1822]|nr:hypothetical protein LPJ76_003040 [Coemansia sp. RSA 638]KAJ2542335.1 hypothetical protein GGF49_002976 [Coemansia sp. RSA 1853]KAJ2566260.1 hypothetical protein GGH12_000990 [Coemansia sp. RSA 1822]
MWKVLRCTSVPRLVRPLSIARTVIPRSSNFALTTAAPSVLKRSINTTAQTIDALDEQATAIVTRTKRGVTKRQIADIIQQCSTICEQGVDTAHTRQLCAIADRLALYNNESGSTDINILAAYANLYAQLGRPDIVQHAMKRKNTAWSRLPLRMYATQQLALLRFRANTNLLARTDEHGDAARIEQRLMWTTVRSMVDAQGGRERVQRWMARTMVLCSCAVFAWLGYKWVQVSSRLVAPDGSGIARRAVGVAASVALAVVSARVAMRYSFVGKRMAHDNSSALWARGLRTGSAELTRADEQHVLRLLWRAFPAAPFDRAVDEINTVLGRVPGEMPRMRWHVRAALQWSLFVRRLGIIEAPMLGDHGVRQRLAVMWLRNLPQMFAAGEHRTAASPVSGENSPAAPLVAEFAQFLDDHFGRVPFALAPNEARAMSCFVASTSVDALSAWLRVVMGGRVAVDPQRMRDDVGSEFLSFRRAADESMLFALPSDIARFQAAARTSVLTALLSTLSSSPQPNTEMLDLVLSELIIAHTALTPSLCTAALSAARAMDSPATARKLIEMAEAPGSFVHQLPQSPPSAGWRLPGESPPQLPIVACIEPYVHWVARASPSELAPFIERWTSLRILSTEAAVQCVDSIIATFERPTAAESEWVATWTELACSFVRAQTEQHDHVSHVLSRIVARAMDRCTMHDRLRAYTAWALASRIPSVRNMATPDLTRQVLGLLVQMSETDATLSSANHLRMALSCLDQMRVLGHVPAPKIFARLCRSAARLDVNIEPYVSYWSDVIRKKSKTAKLDSFAQSLF